MTDTLPTISNRYLLGNMAPVEQELTAFDLPVTGSIPAELEGRWLRNGPNPRTVADPATHHWFLGDGMVHGVRLRGGTAEWYRNRYVSPETGFGPNTNVGGFAGTTWAMVEAGQPPVELGYELEPLGVNRFHDTLTGPFTAHPKYDPTTGELHAMAYHWPDLVDHIHYVVVGGDGRVTKTLDIPVPDMPMIHDMSLTPTYAVVYDLPVTVSFDVMGKGYPFPFAWNPDRAARVGLLPRQRHRRRHHLVRRRPLLRVPSPQRLRRGRRDRRGRPLSVRHDDGERLHRSVRRGSPDVRPLGDRPGEATRHRDEDRRPAPGVPTPQPAASACSGTGTATPRRSHPGRPTSTEPS